MVIPSTGAISMNTIQTEFGGSNPISLNEYYRGGNLVTNAANVTINNSIPTSGAISMNNFRGSAAFYGLQQLVSSGGLSGFEAEGVNIAYAYFDIGGSDFPGVEYQMYTSEGLGVPAVFTGGEWVRGISNSPGDYEIRVNVITGALSLGGPANTWLRLNTPRSFGAQRFEGIGVNQCTANVQIRLFSTGTVIYTTPTLTFRAELVFG